MDKLEDIMLMEISKTQKTLVSLYSSSIFAFTSHLQPISRANNERKWVKRIFKKYTERRKRKSKIVRQRRRCRDG